MTGGTTGLASALRAEIDRLKRDGLLLALIGGAVALRHAGACLMGRCPFHDDRRPSLAVWEAARSRTGVDYFRCFGCGARGDLLDWIARVDPPPPGVGLARHTVERHGGIVAAAPPPSRGGDAVRVPSSTDWRGDPEARLALAVAVDLYAGRLGATTGRAGEHSSPARRYLLARGFGPRDWRLARLGWAGGRHEGPSLVAALGEAGRARYGRDGDRRLLDKAVAVGLLAAGSLLERFLGRVVIPDRDEHGPFWLTGRHLAPDAPRKYLNVNGPKPIADWHWATAVPGDDLFLVEGRLDSIALLLWGYPAVGLNGNSLNHAQRGRLRGFARLFIVLDNDAEGVAAMARLAALLGDQAFLPLRLPTGVKDPAGLRELPDGHRAFARCVAAAGAGPNGAGEVV